MKTKILLPLEYAIYSKDLMIDLTNIKKLLAFSILVISSVLASKSNAENFGQLIRPLTGGAVYENCSLDQTRIITDAMQILLTELTTNYQAFQKCIMQAPLVEWNCLKGQGRKHIVDSIRNSSAITKVSCYTAPPRINGEAPVNINNQTLSLDHTFVSNSLPRRIASVVIHELMHNKGYRHTLNGFGSTYYSNTVPEQAEACVLNGNPNRSAGPATNAFWNVCDGGLGKTERIHEGARIHVCPSGTYMVGVHINQNRFLCQPFGSYRVDQEFVDKQTQEFGMHNCPRGTAMTGLHANKNWLLCAPIQKSRRRYVDGDNEKPNQRHNMHTCPLGSVMTGIHINKNRFTCES